MLVRPARLVAQQDSGARERAPPLPACVAPRSSGRRPASSPAPVRRSRWSSARPRGDRRSRRASGGPVSVGEPPESPMGSVGARSSLTASLPRSPREASTSSARRSTGGRRRSRRGSSVVPGPRWWPRVLPYAVNGDPGRRTPGGPGLSARPMDRPASSTAHSSRSCGREVSIRRRFAVEQTRASPAQSEDGLRSNEAEHRQHRLFGRLRQQRCARSQRRSRRRARACSAAAVLPQDAIDHVDVTCPLRGLDDEDTLRADGDVDLSGHVAGPASAGRERCATRARAVHRGRARQAGDRLPLRSTSSAAVRAASPAIRPPFDSE